MELDKMEAFSIVVKLTEKDKFDMANEMMRIISKSIREDQKNNRFSPVIKIKNKRDERFIDYVLKLERM